MNMFGQINQIQITKIRDGYLVTVPTKVVNSPIDEFGMPTYGKIKQFARIQQEVINEDTVLSKIKEASQEKNEIEEIPYIPSLKNVWYFQNIVLLCSFLKKLDGELENEKKV